MGRQKERDIERDTSLKGSCFVWRPLHPIVRGKGLSMEKVSFDDEQQMKASDKWGNQVPKIGLKTERRLALRAGKSAEKEQQTQWQNPVRTGKTGGLAVIDLCRQKQVRLKE